jgi:hypothetical protein
MFSQICLIRDYSYHDMTLVIFTGGLQGTSQVETILPTPGNRMLLIVLEVG